MKPKQLLLFVLFSVFATMASAAEITDVEIDFSKYKDISEVKFYGWGASESAIECLSIKNGCLHFHSDEATDPTWDCQFHPIGGVDAEIGVTYTLYFKIKGDHTGGVSMLGFGQRPYSQFKITTDWVEGSVEYYCTEANGNLLMQCGDWVGDWDIAYLRIAHDGNEPKPIEWVELLTNGDAENPWADPNILYSDWDNTKICVWTREKGVNVDELGISDPHPAEIITEKDGNHAFVCHATAADTDDDASAWDNQIWLQSPRAWKTGEQFKLSFRYKASQKVVTNTQFHGRYPQDYLYWSAIGDIEFSTEWQTFEQTVTVPSEANGAYSIAFNLNPNVKDPVDFYIDDLSWSEMKLEHGLYVAATNTESGLVPYDYENAKELVWDEEMMAYAATVGKVGDIDSWVNELIISTVRGNDRQFKANSLKNRGVIDGDIETWLDYVPSSNAKITLPAQGVWTVYVDVDATVMALVQIEGDEIVIKDSINIVANPTVIVVNAVERDYTEAEAEELGIENATGQPWDNQFMIMANRKLEAGEETVIEFHFYAAEDARCGTQCGGSQPGAYVHWGAIGDVNFTTEEQIFSKNFKVSNDADGMQSLTFNLAEIKNANKYTIKDIIWKLADDTESLIDMEGTANFFVKEGAGTLAYEFGTGPYDPKDNINVSGSVIIASLSEYADKINASIASTGRLTVNVGMTNRIGDYVQQASGSAIFNQTVTADNVSVGINLVPKQWKFISFPYDVKVADIQKPTNAVFTIRKYSGEKRANGEDAWVKVNTTETLNANEGYIISADNGTTQQIKLTFPAAGSTTNFFGRLAKNMMLASHSSAMVADCDWNFIGNPFPSYYTTPSISGDVVLTIWNGSGYTAYSTVDDNYMLKPFEAFFIQRPINVESISLPAGGRSHGTATTAARLRVAGNSSNRTVLNFVICDSDSNTEESQCVDRARIVINELSSTGYEAGRDAAKFMSIDKTIPQIFVVSNGESLAIDERPMANGHATLGVYSEEETDYILSLRTLEPQTSEPQKTSKPQNLKTSKPIYIIDNVSGTVADLTTSDYRFTAAAGTDSNRFTVVLKGNADGIEEINNSQSTMHNYYNLAGQRINSAKARKGIVIINGKKMVGQ